MNEDVKEYWNNHDDLRMKLSDSMYAVPKSFCYYAKEIGISAPSLISFLKGERRVDFRTWCKINRYVLEKEKL